MTGPVPEDHTGQAWDDMLADDNGKGSRQPGDPLGGDR